MENAKIALDSEESIEFLKKFFENQDISTEFIIEEDSITVIPKE